MIFRRRKIETNARAMIMNSYGLRTNRAEKIDRMIEFCKNNKKVIAMLSEERGKWTTRNTDMMISKITIGKRKKFSLCKK